MSTYIRATGMVLLVFLLAACSAAPAAPPDIPAESMQDAGADEMESEGEKDEHPGDMDEDMADKSSGMEISAEANTQMDEEMDDSPELPAWYDMPLTDVASGESFTISDYKGRVILVETLAMWCSNCMKQQQEVKALHEALGERDDFIGIGIDIDTKENPADLKAYSERNGFHWKYTVASEQVIEQISTLYGAQFLNPPSTPILIIDPSGQAHPLPFGIKSAADLQEAVEAHFEHGM